MNNMERLLFLALGLSVFSISAKASDTDLKKQGPLYSVNGNIRVQIPISLPENFTGSSNYEENIGVKTISLMNVITTPELLRLDEIRIKNLGNISEQDFSGGITPFPDSFTTYSGSLGMNNVPVLDQGQEGTCVTFSTTAALDAFIGRSYIDQQCSLEMDIANYQAGYAPRDPYQGNYWLGANMPSQVLIPLLRNGMIPINQCFDSINTWAGSTLYPKPEARLKSLRQYTRVSNKLTFQNVKYSYINAITINDVIKSINSGHRELIGLRVGLKANGFDAVINGKTNIGGLWACQQPSDTTDYCNSYIGGHEVIVTGYDNNQQLLKIRNSWNTSSGDSGEYYMTYTYFSRMVMDGTEVYL